MVELAHSIGQTPILRNLYRGHLLLPRHPEEFGESAVRLEVAPDHHRVVGFERFRHPIDQWPREPQRVANLAHG